MLTETASPPAPPAYMTPAMVQAVAVESARRAKVVHATVTERYRDGRENQGLSAVAAMHEALRAARRGELAAMRNAPESEMWVRVEACGSIIADVIDPFQRIAESPSNVDRILSALRWMASLEAPPTP